MWLEFIYGAAGLLAYLVLFVGLPTWAERRRRAPNPYWFDKKTGRKL